MKGQHPLPRPVFAEANAGPDRHLLVDVRYRLQVAETLGCWVSGGFQTAWRVLLPRLHGQVVHLKDLLHRLAKVVVGEAQLQPQGGLGI